MKAILLCCFALGGLGAEAFILPASSSTALIPTVAPSETCRNAASRGLLSVHAMAKFDDAAADSELSGTIEQQQQHTTQQARPLRLRRRVAHVAASFAVVAAGAPLLSHIIRTIQPDSPLAQTLLPAADASIFKKYNQRSLKEKLSNVPVYMITNGRNNLYLSPTKEDEPQAAVIFTSYEDANDMMFEMLQNPQYNGEVQIMVMTLEDAYARIKSSLAEVSRDSGSLIYQFHESVHAREQLSEFHKSLGMKDMSMPPHPVFAADGLVVNHEGVDISPLFFDFQDLSRAWMKAVKADPTMPVAPKVKVYNLPDVIVAMEAQEDKFKDVGFYPSTKSMQVMKEVRSQRKTRARPYAKLWQY